MLTASRSVRWILCTLINLTCSNYRLIRGFLHTLLAHLEASPSLVDISRMSVMSPRDAAEVAKSVGIRPEQSPLLDLAFDPFRCVHTAYRIYWILHTIALYCISDRHLLKYCTPSSLAHTST